MSIRRLRIAAFTALSSAALLLNARADITIGLVGYWSLRTVLVPPLRRISRAMVTTARS